jgi:flagellar hook-associated protein 1 FlgK
MSNLLGIGASGVRAYQTALGVVSENIANAGTAGYVRREVKLTESGGIAASGVLQISRGAAGGVDATGVTRSWDSFKATAVRTATADLSSSEASITYLSQIESALSANNVATRLTQFFNAATALSADATGSASRAAFLTQADAVATAFRSTATALDTLSGDVAADAQTTIDQLNSLGANLAKINAAIPRTSSDSAATAALFDQRDAILDKMSSIAGVSVSLEDNGVADVRLGSSTGPQLVSNISANRLKMTANASGTLSFSMITDGNHLQSVAISGGALAGLADAAARIADTRAGLDDVANGFAAAVNGIQAAGVDRDGNAGKPLFATSFATVLPLPSTSGGASVETTVSASATPSAGGYTASWDATAAQWTVARADGTGTPVSGTGTLTIDGISVSFGGSPQPGDAYQIDAGSGALGLAAQPLSTREVATAAKWTVDAPIANGGSGTLKVVPDATATGLPVLPSYKVTYTDGNLIVTDPATDDVLLTTPYTAGTSIAGAGFNFTVTGTPAEGDTFNLTPTGADSLDNSNLASYDKLRTTGAYEDRIDGLANANAAALNSRKSLADAQGAIRDNAIANRDSVSGVNLDNEAVDLLRFQQAYQASSRVIQIARETFQNILDIM